ncbi:Clp protease ClpP [bacterium 210820-DFI.6.37]|nr:Clp protease ClpP [bacterium 210820-DFI.6.37]
MKASKQIKNSSPISRKQPITAYNMAILDDDSAEINMYGDVVPVYPTDYWTGERLPGNYIALDEFLEDLEQIKDKGDITIHINSSGGDLYAGLAIYNRLKALPGNITTINDGMAASAASLILQAGDTRKVNAASNTMAHGVAGFLFGYYNVEDLKTTLTQFEAHNKAIVNVYAEAMGVPYAEAKHFVKNETWLTGQEAVDKGLADEVIEEEEIDEEEENFMNSLTRRLFAFYGKPVFNSAIPAAAPRDANKIIVEPEGGNEMIKTVKELRDAYPDLVAQVETAAKEKAMAEGAASERNRIKEIEAIEAGVADKPLVDDAKFGESPLTAEQLALKAMQKQSAIGASVLNNLGDDTKASGAANIKADPKAAEEDEEEEEKEKINDLVNVFNKINGKGGGK